YFCACVERAMRRVGPGTRSRILWLASREATEIILIGSAIALMTIALMLTTSRSGILGLLGALGAAASFGARRHGSASRRPAVVSFLAIVLVIAVGVAGIETIAARFVESDALSLDGRLRVWADSWRLIRAFPLTGTGLNTFGSAMLFYQTADPTKHFAQAHND